MKNQKPPVKQIRRTTTSKETEREKAKTESVVIPLTDEPTKRRKLLENQRIQTANRSGFTIQQEGEHTFHIRTWVGFVIPDWFKLGLEIVFV